LIWDKSVLQGEITGLFNFGITAFIYLHGISPKAALAKKISH